MRRSPKSRRAAAALGGFTGPTVGSGGYSDGAWSWLPATLGWRGRSGLVPGGIAGGLLSGGGGGRNRPGAADPVALGGSARVGSAVAGATRAVARPVERGGGGGGGGSLSGRSDEGF